MSRRSKNGIQSTIAIPKSCNSRQKRFGKTAVGVSSLWLMKPQSKTEEQISVHGVPFSVDLALFAARSLRVAEILQENGKEDLSNALRKMPGDASLFEQVSRFCHGFDATITTGNAIPLCCLADYLGMTEAHSPGNLLSKVSAFIQDKILPSWNESVKAIRTSEPVLQLAADLGLVEACMKSIVAKAMADPRLLGEPMESRMYEEDIDEEDEEDGKERKTIRYGQRAVRRRLFDVDWQLEDLTMLSLQLYEPIMLALIHNKVHSGCVASSLCEYVNKWVMPCVSSSHNASKVQARKVMEAVERMLPDQRGLIPSTILFTFLRFAILLDAGSVCRNGLEARIGKQLELASMKDLLIPSQGYAKEVQYDVECVNRILKIFYGKIVDPADLEGQMLNLMRVAVLMEEFLAEVANDIDLKLDTFTRLAELSAAATSGSHRCSDGIYRAIDIYLDKHRYLTETERDKVCQVLDCHMLSPEAVEHAAQNERLPLRVVVQALFADQLKLRTVISGETQFHSSRDLQGPTNELGLVKVDQKSEQAVGSEIVKMESKVMELEKECLMLRNEIEIGKGGGKKRKEKEKAGGASGGGMWKEMKRKFGCMTVNSSVNDMQDCNCQVIKKKKIHPR